VSEPWTLRSTICSHSQAIATHLFAALLKTLCSSRRRNFRTLFCPTNIPPGSSLMPQKKNPERVGKLLRGKTGRINRGTFQSVHHAEKACPPATSATCRKTKEALFCRARSDARHDLGSHKARLIATKFREDRLCAAASNPASSCHRWRPITLLIAGRAVPPGARSRRQKCCGKPKKKQRKPWTQLFARRCPERFRRLF